MSRVLLVLAHGSRVEKSNQEIIDFTAHLSDRIKSLFDRVEPCFLELTAPRFKDTLSMVAEEGAEEIVIYPHFLAEGRHVRDDIPKVVTRFEKQYPKVTVKVEPYLGQQSALLDFVANCLS